MANRDGAAGADSESSNLEADGWWRDPIRHAPIRERYGSSQAAARAIGNVSPRTAQDWWARLLSAGCVTPSARATNVPVVERRGGAPKQARDPDGEMLGERAKVTDLRATLTSAANPRGTAALDPAELLRRHSLNPDEWDFTVSATEWDALAGDGSVTTLSRIKVDAIKRPEAFFAFELPTDWRPDSAKPSIRDHSQPTLAPILADPHWPNCQPELIEAFIAWCEAFRPEAVWCIGDAANNSPFGRHGVNRRTDCGVNEAIWSTTEGLARIAAATPGADRMLLFGNHDYWLEKRVLELFPKLAELKRHDEQIPHLAISTVLRLDDIGWGYHYTEGEYHDVDVEIAPGLVGMHGTRAGKHGGALKELERWEGVSIVQGHDHTLGMTAVRYRRPNGEYEQRLGISAGSAANADLGYDPGRNVGQGFPVLGLWPDGRWHVDFALYDPASRSTTWRDWRWDAD